MEFHLFGRDDFRAVSSPLYISSAVYWTTDNDNIFIAEKHSKAGPGIVVVSAKATEVSVRITFLFTELYISQFIVYDIKRSLKHFPASPSTRKVIKSLYRVLAAYGEPIYTRFLNLGEYKTISWSIDTEKTCLVDDRALARRARKGRKLRKVRIQ